MSLAALQHDFRAWLTDAPGAIELWTGEDARAEAGLAVYHNAYRVQLVDCLRETFEHTLAWLGDDAFAEAARTHIVAHPPHGWTLGIYGDGFDRTLATLYPDDPEVPELAWLEWTLAEAFSGADATPIDPAGLDGMVWEEALFAFVPTLSIATATTNAGAIWSALAAGEQPPSPEMLPHPGALLVWRQGFTPCFRTIDSSERVGLALACAGGTFGEMCAALVAERGEEEGIGAAGAMLGQWLHDGLIAGVARRNLGG